MRIIPRSLLARTTLVIVVALVASQLVSVLLFSNYSREPRIQLAAIGFMTHLRTIRTALETIPAEQHQDFIQKLREEGGVRVVRPRADENITPAPNIPALSVLRDRLRDEFGPDADIFQRQRPKQNPAPANNGAPNVDGSGSAASNTNANANVNVNVNANINVNAAKPPVLIVKIFVHQKEFWVVFPRNRIVDTDYSWAWVGWGVFGGLLALAGAVFLVSRVTRPLRDLARAAREFGQGKNPKPVDEIGPEEVKSVAVAFNQMRDDLNEVERERTTFLAGLSHDLRTPLSRLRLGIEMLPAEPETRRELEQDIDDINNVISQFMDFARDENSEALEPTDLNVLAQNAAERATRIGANITLELAAVQPCAMRPLAMQRVISNLIDNAMKHAGPNMTVRTESNPEHISLSVLDHGPGIPANETERLKQPFTKLDEARSGGAGAGLGLAIIDRIVKMHGGIFLLMPLAQADGGGGLEARIVLPIKLQ